MGYFMRVLGIYEDPISVDDLMAELGQQGLTASLKADRENEPW